MGLPTLIRPPHQDGQWSRMKGVSVPANCEGSQAPSLLEAVLKTQVAFSSNSDPPFFNPPPKLSAGNPIAGTGSPTAQGESEVDSATQPLPWLEEVPVTGVVQWLKAQHTTAYSPGSSMTSQLTNFLTARLLCAIRRPRLSLLPLMKVARKTMMQRSSKWLSTVSERLPRERREGAMAQWESMQEVPGPISGGAGNQSVGNCSQLL